MFTFLRSMSILTSLLLICALLVFTSIWIVPLLICPLISPSGNDCVCTFTYADDLSMRFTRSEIDLPFRGPSNLSAVILPWTNAPFTESLLPLNNVATTGPFSPTLPEWMWACVTPLRPSASIWYQTFELPLFTINPLIPVAVTSGCDGTSFLPFRTVM